MKIPFSKVQYVQWKLQIMVFGPDDLSAGYFVYGGPLPKKDAREDWQNTVEIIYRLLKSKLLFMVGVTDTEDIGWFYEDLKNNDPFDQYESGIWMDQLLYPSSECKALLKKYGIDNYDAPTSKAFWDEVEALFEAAGVPWTDKPLIPIRPEGVAL